MFLKYSIIADVRLLFEAYFRHFFGFRWHERAIRLYMSMLFRLAYSCNIFNSIYLTWNSSNSWNKLLLLLLHLHFAIFSAILFSSFYFIWTKMFTLTWFNTTLKVYVSSMYARQMKGGVQNKWNTYSSDSSFLMISFKSGRALVPWLHLYLMCKCCLFAFQVLSRILCRYNFIIVPSEHHLHNMRTNTVSKSTAQTQIHLI